MMRQVFWGLTFAAMTGLCPVAAQAQLFGPSDEEKAHEASQDSQLNQLSEQAQQSATRIQALEDKVRSLTDSLAQATGATENLSHQLDVLNDKLERQSRDFAYRLCTLSAQQLGADAANLNCGASGASPGMMSQPQQMSPGALLPPLSASGAGDDSAAPARGRPPGVPGTLPANGGATRLSSAAPVGPSGGGASQFDSAMNLLAKAQYAEASAAFRAYADSNPDDSRSGAPGDLLGGRYRLCAAGLSRRLAQLRRADQEISHLLARPDSYVEARPVAAGDGRYNRKAAPRLARSSRNSPTPAKAPSRRRPPRAKPPAPSERSGKVAAVSGARQPDRSPAAPLARRSGWTCQGRARLRFRAAAIPLP